MGFWSEFKRATIKCPEGDAHCWHHVYQFEADCQGVRRKEEYAYSECCRCKKLFKIAKQWKKWKRHRFEGKTYRQRATVYCSFNCAMD